jgi:hypothetical protein
MEVTAMKRLYKKIENYELLTAEDQAKLHALECEAASIAQRCGWNNTREMHKAIARYTGYRTPVVGKPKYVI